MSTNEPDRAADTGTGEGIDDAFRRELTRVLRGAYDAPDLEVDGLRLLSGGASRSTWSLDAVERPGGARHPLVLQRTRGEGDGLGLPMEIEDRLLRAAAAAGVPVPAIVLGSAELAAVAQIAGGGTARLAERVAGETLGPRIVRDDRFAGARAQLAAQCGEVLARIHRIDPAAVPGLAHIDVLDRLRIGLDLAGEQRPAFELALRWLADHRPDDRSKDDRGARVVHGDFRVGNLVVDESGLRAVLDWELAHLGDPLEDLGWLCVRAWRFGGDGTVGGVGDVGALVDAYRGAGGREVAPAALHWWIVAGTLTWGLICAVQARRHLDGGVRSVELATIGRRVCETEYDLLQLLGVPPSESGAAGDAEPDGADVHGRPTAAELVDAVRGHLVDNVAPRSGGADGFHLKVAVNALAMVERELRLAARIEARHRADLDALGVADETELAAGLRDGTLEADARVLGAVRRAVVDRVRVANPRWLEPPDTPGDS